MILHEDSSIFYDKCMDILRIYGKDITGVYILGSQYTDARIYEDDLIKIIISNDGLWGEMERKSNRNPFFMKYNGDIIRFHGEFAYLDEHINNLMKE